jgi:hypothetical protein
MEPLQAKIVTTARGLIDFLSILVEREAVSAEDWRAFAQDETIDSPPRFTDSYDAVA